MGQEYGVRRLASLLAREAAYRAGAGKRAGRSSLTRFNSIWAILLASYSTLVGASSAATP
ncbi:MAG: hypothetical protein QI223_06700 [Candidatus Korarchaeota archaeon]|nr:hypothetical protein [Candidatus Korarchaeota archaeon]